MGRALSEHGISLTLVSLISEQGGYPPQAYSVGGMDTYPPPPPPTLALLGAMISLPTASVRPQGPSIRFVAARIASQPPLQPLVAAFGTTLEHSYCPPSACSTLLFSLVANAGLCCPSTGGIHVERCCEQVAAMLSLTRLVPCPPSGCARPFCRGGRGLVESGFDGNRTPPRGEGAERPRPTSSAMTYFSEYVYEGANGFGLTTFAWLGLGLLCAGLVLWAVVRHSADERRQSCPELSGVLCNDSKAHDVCSKPVNCPAPRDDEEEVVTQVCECVCGGGGVLSIFGLVCLRHFISSTFVCSSSRHSVLCSETQPSGGCRMIRVCLGCSHRSQMEHLVPGELACTVHMWIREESEGVGAVRGLWGRPRGNVFSACTSPYSSHTGTVVLYAGETEGSPHLARGPTRGGPGTQCACTGGRG